MGKRRRETHQSREDQLKTLNRNLIRIGAILVVGAAVFELLVQPQFSLQRFLFLIAAAVLGLLVGRTLGKIFFISRD